MMAAARQEYLGINGAKRIPGSRFTPQRPAQKLINLCVQIDRKPCRFFCCQFQPYRFMASNRLAVPSAAISINRNISAMLPELSVLQRRTGLRTSNTHYTSV